MLFKCDSSVSAQRCAVLSPEHHTVLETAELLIVLKAILLTFKLPH